MVVTICDLISEAKKRGIKGYSGLRKAQIQALLNKNKPVPAPPAREKPKKKKKLIILPDKPKLPAKRITYKPPEDDVTNMAKRSVTYLNKLLLKLQTLADNQGTTMGEKENARNRIEFVKKAKLLAQQNKKKK